MNFLTIIFYCSLYAVLNVFGAAIIKLEVRRTPIVSFSDYINILINYRVIGALFIIFISALIMFKALSIGKFSVVIPLSAGINFGLTVVLGVFLFKDNLSLLQMTGLFLILLGIIIISLGNEFK